MGMRANCRGLALVVAIAWGSAPAQTAAPADASQLTRPFVGSWTGVLQYRDFHSDEMVRLPTWLEVTEAAGGALRFTYTYDDGPTKTVVEESTVMLDAAAGQYVETSSSDHASNSYRVTGLEELKAKGTGVLALTGRRTENNKPVDVRITLTIGRNIYIFRKETRPEGGEFRFRDEYVLTRRLPPAHPN